MIKFTIKQLKYADEVCTEQVFYQLLKKHSAFLDRKVFPSWLRIFPDVQNSLLRWVFSFSSEDLEDGWAEVINTMITDLLEINLSVNDPLLCE